MDLKAKMIGLFGAFVMTTAMISGVSAQSTSADVQVKVGSPDGATIGATITGARFQEVKYRAGSSFQNSAGTLTVTATDTRGIGSGWTVTIKGSGDFKDGDKTFPLSTFSLQPGSVQGQNNANANGITPNAIGNMTTSDQTIMTAAKGKGLGVFTDTIQGNIAVPDGTLVGDYTTNLTVTMTASN